MTRVESTYKRHAGTQVNSQLQRGFRRRCAVPAPQRFFERSNTAPFSGLRCPTPSHACHPLSRGAVPLLGTRSQPLMQRVGDTQNRSHPRCVILLWNQTLLMRSSAASALHPGSDGDPDPRISVLSSDANPDPFSRPAQLRPATRRPLSLRPFVDPISDTCARADDQMSVPYDYVSSCMRTCSRSVQPFQRRRRSGRYVTGLARPGVRRHRL